MALFINIYYLFILRVIFNDSQCYCSFFERALHPNAIFTSNTNPFVLDVSISNYTSNFPQAFQ